MRDSIQMVVTLIISIGDKENVGVAAITHTSPTVHVRIIV